MIRREPGIGRERDRHVRMSEELRDLFDRNTLTCHPDGRAVPQYVRCPVSGTAAFTATRNPAFIGTRARPSRGPVASARKLIPPRSKSTRSHVRPRMAQTWPAVASMRQIAKRTCSAFEDAINLLASSLVVPRSLGAGFGRLNSVRFRGYPGTAGDILSQPGRATRREPERRACSCATSSGCRAAAGPTAART